MDEFASLKEERSRHHPEDVSSDEPSDRESDDGNDSDKLELSDDDFFDGPTTGEKDKMFRPSTSCMTGGSYNTGVKGVIADATSFESARRQKARPRTENQYPDFVAPPPPPPARSSSRSEGESEEEEEFVRTWRKNRIQELRTGSSSQRRQSPSKRMFGRVESVDAAGYLDAVEKVSRETVVVVTIVNEQSEESNFVEDCLYTLARKYVTTRFVKLHYQEAEMDSAVVPAVLAYKGGDLFANIMRIVDEIPAGRSLSADSLEYVLRGANVLHDDPR